MAYRGIVGVRDAANGIKARQNGILVLGVFTGKEIDLEAERLIYWKRFYIYKGHRKIFRYSDHVFKESN